MRSRFIDIFYYRNCNEYIASQVYQYDTGLQLRISGLPTGKVVQIQYSIDGVTKTLNNDPQYDGAYYLSNIPNVLLAQTKSIICYVCVSDEASNITVFHIKIPVIPREKPADYQFTQQEIIGFAKLMGELNIAIEDVNELNKRTEEIVDGIDNAYNTAAETVKAATEAVENIENVQQEIDNQFNGIQLDITNQFNIMNDRIAETVYVDRSETGEPGVPAPNDADTLGGIPAKDYVLKTDISDMSSSLPTGGTPGQVLSVVSDDGEVAWVDVSTDTTVNWSEIQNVPSEFIPTEHSHTAEDVGAKPDDYVPSWNEIQNKPETFAPSEHTHDPIIATSDTLGCVKVGDGLSVASDGTISISNSSSLKAASMVKFICFSSEDMYGGLRQYINDANDSDVTYNHLYTASMMITDIDQHFIVQSVDASLGRAYIMVRRIWDGEEFPDNLWFNVIYD